MRKYPKPFIHLKQETKKYRSAQEWVPIAEKLAAMNDGFLPNTSWLQNNKYHGLMRAIRKHPELFQHIKRKKKRLTVTDEQT